MGIYNFGNPSLTGAMLPSNLRLDCGFYYTVMFYIQRAFFRSILYSKMAYKWNYSYKTTYFIRNNLTGYIETVVKL